MARLNRKKRRRIARRVGAKFDYEIAGLRGEQRSERKRFVNQRDSLHAATQMARRATLATNLKGLGGPEGRQLRQEVKGRAADITRGLPGLLAAEQREHKSTRADIGRQIQDARFARSQSIQEEIRSVLQRKKKEELAAREEQAKAKIKTGDAYREAVKLIQRQSLINADPNVDDKDKTPGSVPQTRLEWLKFEDALAKREGVDPASARAAIARLRRRLGRGNVGLPGLLNRGTKYRPKYRGG